MTYVNYQLPCKYNNNYPNNDLINKSKNISNLNSTISNKKYNEKNNRLD